MEWQPQGPRPTTRGQVEGIFDREVVGAIQALAVHPVDPDVIYLAAVNGGIWRTVNATAEVPTWQPLTDLERSLSFGALEFDPTDPSHLTLLAGTGRFSSKSSSGGALLGLLRTVDGGATWTTLNIEPARTLHITGVAPRGSTIVASSNTAGVYRSTDAGVSWTLASGAPGTGLPAGAAFDLAGDPMDPARLYTHAASTGLHRSTDIGATWTKISDPVIDALLAGASNVKISVGSANNVYVAICGADGRLAGLSRSGDSGTTWNPLDLPRTTEAGGVVFGIHPGRQARIHLSLAADRTNADIVYVGGDRQPAFNEGTPVGFPQFPNTLGARDYSGRLFRVDASRPQGTQAMPLTHSKTASGTAPHADSRDIAIAPNGVLIESDDGGIYRRTRPQHDDGDWFSMNGDLQVTEFHSVAWDANCRTVIGGAQDTGSPQQLATAARRWPSVSTGDGGVVAVEALSTPGRSTRYSSFQFLGNLRREVYSATGALQSRTPVALRVLGGGPPLVAQFYTPLVLNDVAPTRLVIGAGNGVYESDDQGDTIRAILPGIRVNDSGPIAYGATGNRNVLYIGSERRVFVRTAAHPAPLTASETYPGNATVVGVAVDPNNPQTAFAIDALHAFHTPDAGIHWDEITGNLLARGATVLRSVVYCPDLDGGSVIVGTNGGVFVAEGPSFDMWDKLGTDLPLAPVLRLQYSKTDRLLLAGTLGRGAWTLSLLAPMPEPGRGRTEEGAEVTSFELSAGVVVDHDSGEAYVMSPEGGIVAVQLSTGKPIWRSSVAAKPLAVSDALLVSQAEHTGPGHEMAIVTLDTRQRGALVLQSTVKLPPGVEPTIDHSANRSFTAQAEPHGPDATVSWEFVERPLQGIAPGPLEILPGEEAPPATAAPEAIEATVAEPEAEIVVERGAVRVGLADGAVMQAETPSPEPLGEPTPVTPSAAAPDLTSEALLPDLPEPQFLSADQSHVLTSERVGDESVWAKYRWRIYERGSGRRVGEIRSHVSFTPFFVTGSQVVQLVEPHVRRIRDTLVEEPAQVRAIDLMTGEVRWSHPLRDIIDREAPPP